MTEDKSSKETGGGTKESTPNKKPSNPGGQDSKGFMPRTAKFEGKCADHKGHIYDCSDVRQSDQYTRTTKEIAEYVGRTFTYGGDARLSVETLVLPTFSTPNDPDPSATRTEVRIWEKTVDEYVKQISRVNRDRVMVSHVGYHTPLDHSFSTISQRQHKLRNPFLDMM
jgi:hypothetical protein